MNATEIVWPEAAQFDPHQYNANAYRAGTPQWEAAQYDLQRLQALPRCGAWVRSATDDEFDPRRAADLIDRYERLWMSGQGEPEIRVLVVVCRCGGTLTFRRWPYIEYAPRGALAEVA